MGAVPVFCDVDPETFCITRATVEAAMTDRTRAVIAVDLFGYLPALDELADLGVPAIQDAVLRELLPELDGWNDARRAAARAYADKGLGDHVTLPVFDGDEHVFH